MTETPLTLADVFLFSKTPHLFGVMLGAKTLYFSYQTPIAVSFRNENDEPDTLFIAPENAVSATSRRHLDSLISDHLKTIDGKAETLSEEDETISESHKTIIRLSTGQFFTMLRENRLSDSLSTPTIKGGQ